MVETRSGAQNNSENSQETADHEIRTERDHTAEQNEPRTANSRQAEQDTLRRTTNTQHWPNEEVNLSKYNSGLKLVPEFDGANWEEFKRKLETQFVIMGIDSYLNNPPSYDRSWQIRNDKLATA
jgi:hypothetical protein